MCDYYKNSQTAFGHLSALPVIRVGSTPHEVATYGRAGSSQLELTLTEFQKLNPPRDARLWHQSMEDWITTMWGTFYLLTPAEEKSQADVDQILNSYFIPQRQGMIYELEQLNSQFTRLFSDCR